VKITFGGKAYATAKKAVGKFDETFKIKVGEEGNAVLLHLCRRASLAHGELSKAPRKQERTRSW